MSTNQSNRPPELEVVYADVAGLKVEVKTLGSNMHSMQGQLDRITESVNAGFTEMRRDLGTSGRTNWGWIIGALATLITLVGAIGTAWVRPLQINDDHIADRISDTTTELQQVKDTAVRTDERLRVYIELGLLSNHPAAPTTTASTSTKP